MKGPFNIFASNVLIRIRSTIHGSTLFPCKALSHFSRSRLPQTSSLLVYLSRFRHSRSGHFRSCFIRCTTHCSHSLHRKWENRISQVFQHLTLSHDAGWSQNCHFHLLTPLKTRWGTDTNHAPSNPLLAIYCIQMAAFDDERTDTPRSHGNVREAISR